MTSDRASLKASILDHLRRRGSLSPLEAFGVFNTQRLAARVHDLRNDGWNIKSTKRRDVVGRLYTRYSLGTPRRLKK